MHHQLHLPITTWYGSGLSAVSTGYQKMVWPQTTQTILLPPPSLLSLSPCFLPTNPIMSPAAPHSHRSGKLKQQNKKNKRSNASKRSLNRRAGGKIQTKKGVNSATSSKAKADRVNEAKQRRELKKRELLASRRGLNVGSGVASGLGRIADVTARPRVVGIISLSEEEDGIEEKVREILIENSDRQVLCSSDKGVNSSVTVHYGANKKVRLFFAKSFGSMTYCCCLRLYCSSCLCL